MTDLDNPEWTAEDIAAGKKLGDFAPDLAAKIERGGLKRFPGERLAYADTGIIGIRQGVIEVGALASFCDAVSKRFTLAGSKDRCISSFSVDGGVYVPAKEHSRQRVDELLDALVESMVDQIAAKVVAGTLIRLSCTPMISRSMDHLTGQVLISGYADFDLCTTQ